MPTTVDTTTTKQGCSRQLSGKKFIFFDGTKRNSSSSSSSSKFRLPRRATTALFPLRFLRQLGNKVVVGALTLFSGSKTKPAADQTVIIRSKATTTMAPAIDSHRAEAIKDCIQFINSSSLPRTNSASEKEQKPTQSIQ